LKDLVKTLCGNANLGKLEEVERAEDTAKSAYIKALAAAFLPQVRTVMQRQHHGAVRNRCRAQKECAAR
jgi:uncharacterized protein (TIGR02284 family)